MAKAKSKEIDVEGHGYWFLLSDMIDGLVNLPLETVVKYHIEEPTRGKLAAIAAEAKSQAKAKGWKIKTSANCAKGFLAIRRVE